MKDMLNKLKKPTKILGIICIILLIMLISRCSSYNTVRYENIKLFEQVDSITNRLDSIILIKDSIDNKYKDLMYDKNTSELTNDNKSELINELKLRIADLKQSNTDLKRDKNKYVNENAILRKEILELKNNNLK